MVTADRLETNHTFRLTLKPNRSISWRGNMLFLALISTPILIIAFGFDPILYGVLYTITYQIANMTPPFGYNLFLMRAIAPK